MKIFVIIVTYNGLKWIDKCVGYLRTSSFPVKPIVIDNNSSDDTVKYLKKNYPETILIANNENIGFGRANNIGMKKALELSCDYVFLLNQDAWINENTIEHLISFSTNNPDYGIISPIHLNKHGTAIDQKFGSEFVKQNFDFFNDLLLNTPKEVYDLNFVNADVWLMPKKTLLEIGGFNEFYFMYGYDGDYCSRVLWHEKKIGVVSNAFAYHARDNYHFKRRTFFKNLKFQTKEWYQWSYKEYMFSSNNSYTGLSNSLKLVLEFFTINLFKLKLSSALGNILGWFRFIFYLRKSNLDKRKFKIKSNHFLD